MPTPFIKLAKLCSKLESTKKRRDMIDWVALFLQELEGIEIEPATSILVGKALPQRDQRVLDVNWATIKKVIIEVVTSDNSSFFVALTKTGDVGDATKIIMEKGTTQRQLTLFKKPLSIIEVRRVFEGIADATGGRSRGIKERLLKTLLSNASPLEAKYIVRILLKDMRTGFQEGLMEQAVGKAFEIPLEVVRTANMLTGDIGKVALLAKQGGIEALAQLKFTLFNPTKPMLAQMASTVKEALKEHGDSTAFEYKLDGARVQIHKSGNNVKIFSRRLTDITKSLPEIVHQVKNNLKVEKAVIEGEVVAFGKNGSPLPFQHLMRRFKRIHGIENALNKIPLKLFLFDLLYIDGESFIDRPYSMRRKELSAISGNISLTEQIVTSNLKLANSFLKKAIEAGHEGLMVKKPDSLYRPGTRGKRWLKIKETLKPLDLVIVAAEYGYGKRHGWLSDYCLAALDTETGQFLQVGKTFKGLTDSEIVEMTERLKGHAIRSENHRVIVKPQIVVEVEYNEIQKSSLYICGMALRFARITRIRYDKDSDEIDTIQEMRKIYEEQFEKKSRYSI